MTTPIHHLFITLRKGRAGVREQHLKILDALGLKWRQQTIKAPNNASTRGAIDKIKHLLSVETDEEYYQRKQDQVEFEAVRRPLHFRHTTVPHVQPMYRPSAPMPQPPWAERQRQQQELVKDW